jgi:hypothetical protein
VGFNGPKPGAELRSTVVFSYTPGGSTLGSFEVFVMVTSPLKMFLAESHTSPVIMWCIVSVVKAIVCDVVLSGVMSCHVMLCDV